jgi:Ca2+-binding RTX toxin-like protein
MPGYGVTTVRDFQVNQTFPFFFRGFDIDPDMVRLANGDFVVTWHTAGDTSPQHPPGIALQRYNADATTDGAPVFLATNPSQQSIAALTDGGYVIAWKHSAANDFIEYERFDSTGALVGSVVAVTAPAGGDEDSFPEVVGLAGGGWVVTWERGPDPNFPGDHHIYARAYDSAGVAGAETPISTSSGSHTDPAAVALADGSYAILWGRNLGAPDEDVRMWHNGTETVLNGAGSVEDVNVALLPDGRLIVAWSAGDGVDAMFVAADGTPGTPFLAAAGGSDADIAVFADGRFVMAWTKPGTESNGGHTIQGAIFDSNGAVLPGSLFEHAVATFRDFDENLSVVTVGPHDFVITWAQYGGPDFLQAALFTYDQAIDFVGTPGDDTWTGGAANDTAQGLGGNDSLNGGLGNDQLQGGPGNDTYFVDSQGDTVIEAAGEGRDVVYSTVDYTLGAGQSIEVLSARTHAATDPLNLTGNELGQEIWGNAGNNNLRGGGGNDFLIGQGGNDNYFVDTANALVFENAGAGHDVVYSSVDYTLLAGQEIEVLSANNHGATTPLSLTGNELGQEIWGNAGANNLRGGGGSDFLIGQGGNDTYFVDTASALVIESIGNGRDVIYSSVNYTLMAGQEIEVLSASNHAATTPLDFTGNEFRQEIWGNAGANNLRGGGGVDFLLGQGGNDTYFVDVTQTQVYENAGAGHDVVYASVSYTLLAGQEVEVLSTSNHAATNALNMTGNELVQELWGNAGANILDGKLGNDALIGQGGADTFTFTTALGSNNVDFIADFVAGTDRIALDDAIFTGLTPGALPASAFVVGTAAGDADDRIIYNSATGQLYFDADGNGAGAAIQFATLNGHPVITASDFTVI